MKRSSFLTTGVSLAAIIALPLRALAHLTGYARNKTGFFVQPGKDRNNKAINLLEGDTFYTKVSTEDSDGDNYTFESTRLKEGGPSLHYHFEQDEWWYVLKGTFLFKVGDQSFEDGEGGSVFGPRMVPHAFSKVGEGEARMLITFQPAGKMELFFNKLSQGVARNMTEAEHDKLREEHGFKRVGPPIKYLKKL